MSERIVLDTNVLVSAMLVQGSMPDQVLGSVLAGRSRMVVDGRIMSEYRAVLSRPEFGFDPNRVDDVIAFLERSEWIIADPLSLQLLDAGDLPFLEVAVAGGVDALVTGNKKHFVVAGGRIDVPVLSPREYIARLSGRTSRRG